MNSGECTWTFKALSRLDWLKRASLALPWGVLWLGHYSMRDFWSLARIVEEQEMMRFMVVWAC